MKAGSSGNHLRRIVPGRKPLATIPGNQRTRRVLTCSARPRHAMDYWLHAIPGTRSTRMPGTNRTFLYDCCRRIANIPCTRCARSANSLPLRISYRDAIRRPASSPPKSFRWLPGPESSADTRDFMLGSYDILIEITASKSGESPNAPETNESPVLAPSCARSRVSPDNRPL